MPRVDPILIFDLDGTILRRNSFPLWAIAVMTGRAQHLPAGRRLSISFRTGHLLVKRKLDRLGHNELFGNLQEAWSELTSGDSNGRMAANLQRRLLALARPELRPIIQLVAASSVDGLLATAAAAEYADALGRALGFRIVHATKGEHTNSGERKRDRILRYLEEQGWSDRPRIFFNDHMADLPTMMISNAVCWFGSDQGLRRTRAALPGVRLIPCRGLTEQKLSATLAHLVQSLTANQPANTSSGSEPAPLRTSISL